MKEREKYEKDKKSVINKNRFVHKVIWACWIARGSYSNIRQAGV